MPSGPKKRKAARKKKEKVYDSHSDPSSPSAHSHEVDDGKLKDDRESDLELSSPASQDHHSHQILLTDGEEQKVEKEESCSAVPSVKALKIDDNEEPNIVVEVKNAGEAQRESEIPSDKDKKDERIDYDDPSKKTKDGGSSDSSGGGGGGSSSSSSSYDESNGTKSARNVDVSPLHDSVKAAARPSKSLHSDTNTIEEEADSSYPSEKTADCGAVDSVLDENEEEKISSFEHKVYPVTVVFTDAASERKEEKVTIQPIKNAATISNPKAFETQESGHRMTQSYNPVGAKDSSVSESLLAPASHPEKTLWKSCCGLFEVFARSDR